MKDRISRRRPPRGEARDALASERPAGEDEAGPRRAGRPSNPVSKETIIDEALKAFAIGGYRGTTLETIAKRLGIRKASLLYHYPSKTALYEAVLGEVVSDLGRLIAESRLDEARFEDRLDHLGRLIVAYLGRRREAARLVLREVMDGGPFLRSQGRGAIRAVLQSTADFLDAGMEAGVFARQDPRHLVISIAGIHLLYFAVADIAGEFFGEELFSDEALERRAEALVGHVRRICLEESE